jgi:hypothetical protein
MSEKRTEDLQARFIHRAANTTPILLAGSLRAYAELHGQTWEQLATATGITTQQLNRIAACKQPRSEQFEADTHAIADYVGVPANVVDRLLSAALANHEAYTLVAETTPVYQTKGDEETS